MIDARDWRESDDRVAVFADAGRCSVRKVLAGCCDTVVTTGAVA